MKRESDGFGLGKHLVSGDALHVVNLSGVLLNCRDQIIFAVCLF